MEWRPLTADSLKRFYKESQLIVAVNAAGESLVGKPTVTTDKFVTIDEDRPGVGAHTVSLYTGNRAWRWALVEPPEAAVFGVKDPTLTLG